MVILNLGCGKKMMKGAINVDCMVGEGIDMVVDLGRIRWPWEDESVDVIHCSHVLEHFHDQKKFLEECLRILKKGGTLRIVAPHASCIPSIGCMGHYRTYSLFTFNDYLSTNWYMFKRAKFKTVYQRINWWYEKSGDNVPRWSLPIIGILDKVISFVVNLSPRIYENFFATIIPCREIVWEGVKV